MFAHSGTKKLVVRATGDIVHHFQGQKVKGQCHQKDNAVTRNEPYLWNRKAYKLRIWYTDGARRPALTYVNTSKLKALVGCSSHHAKYILTVTAASASRAKAAVSKVAW